MSQKIKSVLAGLAAALSIAIVLWCVYDLITGHSREKPSILVTLAVFYSAVAGWAIHWLFQNVFFKQSRMEKNNDVSHQ